MEHDDSRGSRARGVAVAAPAGRRRRASWRGYYFGRGGAALIRWSPRCSRSLSSCVIGGLPGSSADSAMSLTDDYPQLLDRTATSPFDPHYTYQDAWAAREIHQRSSGPPRGRGLADLVRDGPHRFRAGHVHRRPPARGGDANLESRRRQPVDMPFEDRAVDSLSCLHVAEHIGLGRYGDPLDPDGTRRPHSNSARPRLRWAPVLLRPGRRGAEPSSMLIACSSARGAHAIREARAQVRSRASTTRAAGIRA